MQPWPICNDHNKNDFDQLSQCQENISRDNVKVAKDICNLFVTSAKAAFGFNKERELISMDYKSKKPWFGKECRTARRNFHLAKRIFDKHKSLDNKASLKSTSKQYKKVIDKCI
jgi:hypothetical protein